MDPEDGFIPTTLGGHRQAVLGAWFSKDQETIYTVSKDGALFVWKYMLRPDAPEDTEDDEHMQWRIADRHYFMQNNAHVTCATFHASSNLLVAGFSNGIFGIYELPEFSTIQNLRCVSFISMGRNH